MKKKLFYGFIVSLFVFTLFISVSKAEIAANTDYILAPSITGNSRSITTDCPNSGYTNESVKALLTEYLASFDEDIILEIITLFKSNGFGNIAYYYYPGSGIYFYIYHDNADVAIGKDSQNRDFIFFHSKNKRQLSLKESGSFSYKNFIYTTDELHRTQLSFDYLTGYSVVKPIKSFQLVAEDTWQWDGISYSQAPSEPEEPDFVGISDDEKATIINSVVNSNEFINIVPKNYRNQYFIVYSQWTNTYKIYFYPEQYYLKGRKFVEGEVDGLSYESYKIVAFEGSNFFWDLVQSVSPFQYYIFSGSFDSQNEFSSYFYGYENSHELNQRYFSVQDDPIVYSSRDIGFVIFDLSTGEYVEDTENGIVSAPLVDSSGNEIIIEIPEEEGPESIGFWDSFLLKLKTLFTDLFGMLGATIEFLLNKLFDLPTYLLEQYGENVFTLVFAIIVKALEVLVSSISLLFRFAGFLLTLIAIPADSTLFNVLVDGKVWGAHFIEGLDFLKSLSWNNLSFWRLFEWFVASLEVIWTVRIVRRHYSQIM